LGEALRTRSPRQAQVTVGSHPASSAESRVFHSHESLHRAAFIDTDVNCWKKEAERFCCWRQKSCEDCPLWAKTIYTLALFRHLCANAPDSELLAD
jgi:hypothetical protein